MNLIPSGRLILTQDFKKIKPGISEVGPSMRITYMRGKRIIKREPVYFTIDTLYKFETIRVQFTTDRERSVPFSVGVRTSSLWDYTWQNYTPGEPMEFAWNPYWDNHHIEVAISSPHLTDKRGTIVITNIEATLERGPLTVVGFKGYVRKFFKALLYS